MGVHTFALELKFILLYLGVHKITGSFLSWRRRHYSESAYMYASALFIYVLSIDFFTQVCECDVFL